jgi:hypothetical protein
MPCAPTYVLIFPQDCSRVEPVSANRNVQPAIAQALLLLALPFNGRAGFRVFDKAICTTKLFVIEGFFVIPRYQGTMPNCPYGCLESRGVKPLVFPQDRSRVEPVSANRNVQPAIAQALLLLALPFNGRAGFRAFDKTICTTKSSVRKNSQVIGGYR